MADARLLRPTVFGATVALYNSWYQEFLQQVVQTQAAEPQMDQTAARAEVLQQWRARLLLGNRLTLVIIGGSLVPAHLKKWLWDVLECVVVDGYGSTETGGLAGTFVVGKKGSEETKNKER